MAFFMKDGVLPRLFCAPPMMLHFVMIPQLRCFSASLRTKFTRQQNPAREVF